MRKPIDVLNEAIELQKKKGADYQNPDSAVRQADYYPRGCNTIFDIMWGKCLRIRSVMEAMESGEYKENFESLEDSAIDLINYASFFVSYMDGAIDGQKPGYDFLNRKIKND